MLNSTWADMGDDSNILVMLSDGSQFYMRTDARSRIMDIALEVRDKKGLQMDSFVVRACGAYHTNGKFLESIAHDGIVHIVMRPSVANESLSKQFHNSAVWRAEGLVGGCWRHFRS